MPKVIAVAKSAEPGMPKYATNEINIIANFGVEGDYHAGTKVRHRYLARKYPNRPNTRQVNLLHSELFPLLGEELNLTLEPGQMGENITTEGIDLMALPLGTQLQIGESVVLEITEVRVPCRNLDYLDKRLFGTIAKNAKKGRKQHNAGVLAVVRVGGVVRPGDEIKVISSTEGSGSERQVLESKLG